MDDPNPRVPVAVDPPLVTLGQAEPTLQIQIVPDLLELPLAHEQPGEEADHHPGHPATDRIPTPLEPIDQLLELLPTVAATSPPWVEGRRDSRDVLDVVADRLLFGPDFVEASVDAAGQAAELLLREPPFFSSRSRWIDARTSPKASAIRKPGGWSGPP